VSHSRLVVVGASIAGVTAAESARNAGFDGRITLVGAEDHPPYTRPALSKALLRGHEPAQTVHLPSVDTEIEVLRGARATALDAELRRVGLSDGEWVEYTDLVIATGTRARTLHDFPGTGKSPSGEERTLRSLDDALALRAAMGSATCALIIGGGFVGTEVASACIEAGLRTEVLTRHSRLVPQLGDDLADLVTQRAMAAGMRLTRVDGPLTVPSWQGGLHVVRTSAGEREADLVLTAVGDHPGLEWLASSPLHLDGGIVVDEHCVAAPHIFAVGDVARMKTSQGVAARTPFWTAALEQARVAGEAVVRGRAATPYQPRPYFWTEAFGLTINIAGPIPASGRHEALEGDLAEGAGVFRWGRGHDATVAAVNRRLPIRKLRGLASLPQTARKDKGNDRKPRNRNTKQRHRSVLR
jgi:3-phenylpropionate/trans-cinnamate dioxygenase ferredoxin reductase subunit